ncbi:MAG: hypothetical protein KatS3mg050_0097 [Litorilinea sp.]|nr:MAG: hypothetical protein KatS3mg050_0097 [Litorilinea sp.]
MQHWYRCLLGFCLFLNLFLSGARPVYGQAGSPGPAGAAVSPHLQERLAAADDPISFLVLLEEQVDATSLAVGASGAQFVGQDGDPVGRRIALYKALTATARRSQAPLRAWLEAHHIPYRAFYLVNMLEIWGTAETVAALRTFPGVARIADNPALRQPRPMPAAGDGTLLPLSIRGQTLGATDVLTDVMVPYGVAYTHAPQVWEQGYRGQGVVVASADTGVQWDHPALLSQYRGWDSVTGQVDHTYNWHTASWPADWPLSICDNDPAVPCDDDGHGTHTVGTMLGQDPDGLTVWGMAPDARWMGCRNMQNGVGYPASYIDCFQFFLAPYPPGGDPMVDGRPELAPHIVNNSWACPPSEGCDVDSLRQAVETLRAAGIFVVSSAGNSGPSCKSVNNPIAIYDAAFTVGAHDAVGSLASFSSRGPVIVDGSGRLKPEITAPGVGVMSTYRGNSYRSLSGTSMASPHVAGAVALLWSAQPALVGDVDRTQDVLLKSADPVALGECGDASSPTVPNPSYGYGRLDVAAAVEMARHPATVVITVTDRFETPLPGLQVILEDGFTGVRYRAQSQADGQAVVTHVYPGDYRITVDAGTRIFPIQWLRVEADGEHHLLLAEARTYFFPLVLVGSLEVCEAPCPTP